MTDVPTGEPTGQPALPAAAPVAPSSAALPAAAPAAHPHVAPAAAALPPVSAEVATRAGSWFAGLDPRGWRTTIVVAVLMVGTVFGVNLVNAAVPLPSSTGTVDPGPGVPGDPNTDPGQPTAPPVDPRPVPPGTGLDVGSGVVVYPPDGWSVVGSTSGQVVLQKGAAVILLLGLEWTASPLDLLVAYRDEFFPAGQLTANEPQSLEIGIGIPAAGFQYTGVLDGTQVDGAIIAGAGGGSGVLVNVVASAGGLQAISDDVDHILGTVQLTGGGQ